MKHLQYFQKGLLVVVTIVLIALFATLNSLAYNPSVSGGNYTFQSEKLAFKLDVPDTWKDHIVSEETENAVVFKYSNPGGQPVFLFAINKVSDSDWMKIKDQLTNCGVLMHNGSTIYYYEKTGTTRLKGSNNDEYKAILANLDEVIHSIKSL